MPFLFSLGVPVLGLITNTKNILFALGKFSLFTSYVVLVIGVLFVSSYQLLDGISASVPEIAIIVWGWVMPPNAFGCLTTILTIRILRAGYDFKVQLLKLKVQSVVT